MPTSLNYKCQVVQASCLWYKSHTYVTVSKQHKSSFQYKSHGRFENGILSLSMSHSRVVINARLVEIEL